MQNNKRDIGSYTLKDLSAALYELGQPKFRAGQVFSWLHQKRVTTFDEMSNLSLSLRQELGARYYIDRPRVIKRLRSKKDATEKYLLELADGEAVEAVFMEYKHGNTVCISTQVGCKMGCKFCASTLGGKKRNLTAGEMLGEVYTLERESKKKVGGVVLMGIGEPLDNFENVVDFLCILSDKGAMNLSLRHVSLSTCGIVPMIDRLADYRFALTLSISLHAPDDKTRSAIMPINNKYPVAALLKSCKNYFEKTGRRISFEYALIAGENDTPLHAQRLCALLKGQNCHVNLIPVNEVAQTAARRGSKEAIERFRALLCRGGLNATVRRELGTDINAACGQLRHETTQKKERE